MVCVCVCVCVCQPPCGGHSNTVSDVANSSTPDCHMVVDQRTPLHWPYKPTRGLYTSYIHHALHA